MSAEPLHEAAVRGPAHWRAALYGRVSDKRHGDSVDEQDVETTRACEAEGWPVVGRYSDELSASRFAREKIRPDWERLLVDLKAGKIDVLVVWEVSRLTRDLEVGARLLRTCRDHRVRIYVHTHRRTYNLRIARDWRALADDLVDAGYESEKTSERTSRSRRASAEKGKPHGRVNYGYERIYDARQLVGQRPHEDLLGADGNLTRTGQAPIVREIVRRVGAGVPLSVLAADLNARGVPAPRGMVWMRSTVRSLAMSPVYVGRRHYTYEDEDGIVVTDVLRGEWPALVTDLEHHAAVAVLSDPTRKTTRPGAAKWLLSYLAACRCAAPLTVRAVRGVPMYVCSAPGQCSAIRVDRLDEHVTKAVCTMLSDPQTFPALMAADDAAVATARTDLAALEAQWAAFVDSAVSPAAIVRVEARLTPAIAAARRRLGEVATPPALRVILADGPGDYQVIAARFAALGVAQRKAIVRALLTVELHPARKSKKAPLDARRVVLTPTGG